jgi:CheY-like chemotaxis protein
VIDDAELGLALGAVDFFAKPIDRSLLLTRLRRLLENDDTTPGRPTVLAIDDEPAAVEMYRAMLEPSGFDVVVATSGTAGVAAAKRHRPDAVVLDLTMPDMDGFEVAAALRADPVTEQVPIVVVTSRDLTASDTARLNGHVTGIMRKGDEAVDGLRQWLRMHAGEPPGASAGTDEVPTNGHEVPNGRADLLPAGFVPATSPVALRTSSDGTSPTDGHVQATR